LNREELFAELNRRKDRCKNAFDTPDLSDRIKARVLMPEYQIYMLALEGYAVSQQKKEKQGLLSTSPAQIAVHPMD
jgi:hypothetical protein